MTTFPIEKSVLENYKYTENAFLPKIATVPLIQGEGTLCKSLVKVGDSVEEGDVIGISLSGAGKNSKIHAPIPGKIINIVSVMNYDGTIVPAVQIKLEGKFTYLGKKLEEQKWQNKTSDEIITQLLESGIVNTFICSKPVCLGNQLDEILSDKNKKESAVIVRLFDEDPSRVTDSLITNFYFDKIRIASKILAHTLNTKNILYLLPNKTENTELIEKIASEVSVESDFTEDYILENVTKYPYGTQKEILASVNKLFRKNIKFKISNNDLFIDSSSLLEVYDSVVLGTPSLNKYVHLSGDCLYSSCLLQIKIGTSLKDIVNQLGGFNKTPKEILINGLVCGSEVSDLDVPVTKNVKSIVFRSKYNFCDLNVYSCIKCGNCRNICPVKISPDILYNSVAINLTLSEVEKKSLMLCTDCGLCNTVCPSRLPLSQIISSLKKSRGEE